MTQLERLQEWYGKTTIANRSILVPVAQRISIVENNPNRIVLLFTPESNPGDYQFLPLGPFCTAGIQMTAGGLANVGLYLDIGKHFQLVTCGWDCLSPGGFFNLTVTEVLYQG